MPGPYSSLMVGFACVPEWSRTGGPWEENEDQRRRRSDSTFNFKQTARATVRRSVLTTCPTIPSSRVTQKRI